MKQYKNNFSEIADVNSVLIEDFCEKKLNPVISFLIPTYMRPETIRYAIDSIVRQKCDVELKYEIVIVDNSADFSENNVTSNYVLTLGEYPIRLFINDKNIGVEGNWNRGVELCRGKYVSIIHDDDVLADWYFTDILKYISSIPKVDNVPFIKIKYMLFYDYNDLTYFEESNDVVLRECNYLRALINGECETNTPTCGMLFNRKLLLETGGFDRGYYPSSDSKLGVEFIRAGLIGYTTTRAAAFYHIGINESMKLQTIQGFIKKDYKIRKDLYEMHILGKLFEFVFEKTQYSKRIDHWIKYAAQNFNMKICVEELDFLHCYGKHSIKGFILRFIEKTYNFLINKRIKIRIRN